MHYDGDLSDSSSESENEYPVCDLVIISPDEVIDKENVDEDMMYDRILFQNDVSGEIEFYERSVTSKLV